MTGQFLHVGVLAAVIVALAAIMRLVPSAPRKRLRRSVVLFALHVGLVVAGFALQRFNLPAIAEGVALASSLLEVLLIINLSALALFDLLLPIARVDLPDILHDLTVGASYHLVPSYNIDLGALCVIPGSRDTSRMPYEPIHQGSYEVSALVVSLSLGGRFGGSAE